MSTEHYASDGTPVTVGAKFWSNDLRVVQVSEVASSSNAYADTGETQTWHQTGDGRFDTLSGALQPYGRLVRYFNGSKGYKSAEDYPVGTSYNNL